MKKLLQKVGYMMGCWLSCPRYRSVNAGAGEEGIASFLRPGDVLLVEGSSRFSEVIKYLTQSSWSHAALYIGAEYAERLGGCSNDCFIEADVTEGVRLVGLDEFKGYHLRICRPTGLDDDDIHAVIHFAGARLGYRYDLHNIVDLARYFLPLPPVPQRWRRPFLILGSGDPTRAICSTLIAQAFQSIPYPILPIINASSSATMDVSRTRLPRFKQRHYSLFTPRDFDLSPYFDIVKPRLAEGFDPYCLQWEKINDVNDSTPI
ncbi:YiiX/YebB-like N1pC/P60 family cysteine hydrolase [Vreelandella alkaliphila]|uniref:YiiX/YebB-like N1pC/P60 family cysteine hydrolase n=1 Tax=Vreelandella alkaliphila TaxID=272774 RepID=UPI003F95CB29